MKALLLDIDGVLVRDRNLMKHLSTNCANYVRFKLPDCKDPVETSRLLYLGYGHTARGLERGFGIDTRDFNARVYDNSILDHLARVLATDEFQAEAAEIHSLTRHGWKLRLFTNAPWVWAHKVALAIGDDVNVRCSGNPSDSPLKPEPEAYMFSLSPDGFNVMVDDSLKNLATARFIPSWKCIHFTEEPKSHATWCPQVSSIRELCDAVKNIEQ